jgi:hypothetical protein
MKYIFTNFGCGNGPFIRAIDMAIGLIPKIRPKIGEISIIVPWVYGERQKRIIQEEFGPLLKENPDLILLDKKLGDLFNKVLFDGRNYNTIMAELIANYDQTEKEIQSHLKTEFTAENIEGKEITINGKDILLEVSRNPNVATNIPFSYYTSIGYFEKIIQQAIKAPDIKLDKALLKQVLPIAKRIESYQRLYFQPEPNCFTYQNPEPFKENEIRCPPLFHPPEEDTTQIQPGFYVLVSGIPYLEKIYDYAKRFNYKMYVNQKTPALKDAQRELPNIIANNNIKFVFARAAWNTVWLTNLSEKPFISLDYPEGDFPEIYFNVKCVEQLKLGVVLKQGQDIDKAIKEASLLKEGIVGYYKKIKDRYHTLDGIEYSCKIIAEDFLKNYLN